ncbi:MAG: NAD(P)/FAD-dependent oxidoreductase [Elusimicrobia bacterium]|nr:NAD(P)/FAD-dependent oxidoreductase [Candidatus Liberimonas magnetica]
MEKVDVTIIGAGVIGLAIGAKLSGLGKSCIILEKNLKFGQETSSRNSEVIHSGIYYPHNSLKAKLCVKGNSLLYEHCRRYGIKHSNLGKVIVATTQDELASLEKLKNNGINNGVPGLELISKGQLMELEPEVEAKAALLCKSTGILDTHTFMQSLLNIAEESKAIVSYDSEVTAIEKLTTGFRLTLKKDNYKFDSEIVVNCAGLNSDIIAALCHINVREAGYKLHYCKGNYFRTRQKLKARRLIYPVPFTNIHGLGVHLTLDMAGSVRFGPDTHYIENIDYTVSEDRKDDFYNSIKKYLPSIRLEDLYPDTCGVRPKLQGPDDDFKDFIIVNEKNRNLDGLINLIGIESPGLTSALSIADYVAELI